MKKQKATFAAGCFWGIEAEFRKVKGVIEVISGYTGGNFKNPSYEDVCYNKTGHTEAVEITFDQEKVSFKELLDVFWKVHNPTTKNRQGFNLGDHYRSAIFYHNEQQKKQATVSKEEHQKTIKKVIVTEITKASTFYKAEEYHQRYLEKHGKAVC